MRNNKIASIELLRFISSMMILIWHYQHFFYPYNLFSKIEILKDNSLQPFFKIISIFYTHGQIGVDIFFAISGFVFSYIYINNETKALPRNFWLNRFSRLYPLHFLTLFIILFLQNISLKFYGTYQITSVNDLYHFILNIFFISGWGFEKNYSFNSPIWSVSLELIIYALFFLTIINTKKFIFLKALSVFITLLILRKLNFFDNSYIINFELIVKYGSIFYTGVIAYFLYDKFDKRILLFILSIILILISFTGNFKILTFCPGILILFLSFESFLNVKLRKIFCLLGDLTYSMYLLHLPLQILLILLIKINNINMDIFLNDLFFLNYIMLVILVSYVSFHKFEKKINTKIKEIFK